jgi:hypothetical protein
MAHWIFVGLGKATLAGLAGVVGLCTQALAFESVRSQEIAQCLPGEIATWGDGRDRPAVASPMVFMYDHSNAPAWFTQSTVLAALTNAQQAWSQCGVAARVVNASAVPAQTLEQTQGVVQVRWSEAGMPGNFGLADPNRRTLSLGPAAFALLQKVNPAYDSSQTLQMVISHEMGHLYGLMAHSRRCVDVTSNYDNGKGERCTIRNGMPMTPGVEYRSLLPTACDIQRCTALNKK